MELARTIARWLLVKPLWVLLGRRNLVRLARFVTNEVRLDLPNAMDRNGELLVQDVAVASVRDVGRIVALDVGAHVGQWTHQLTRAARRAGIDASIHAFEPCPGTAETLRRNLEAWGIATSVTVNEVALSSQMGERQLHSFGSDAGRNSLHPMVGDPAPHLERVRTATLDAYCDNVGLSRVDVLKIDAEGHDLEVLGGGQTMLRERRVGVIQFEYNQRWIASRHYLLDAFELFGAHGYALGKVTPNGIEFYKQWHHELETFREANYVGVRHDLVNRFRVTPWWNEGP